jgi:hypothetical protein
MRTAVSLLLFCLLAESLRSGNPGQQQDLIHEYIGVVNVQVFVRVLQSGRPLAGLAKENFSLFENDRKVEINGFREVRRRIADGGAGATEASSPGRLFLLFFWVNESGSGYRDVLDGFFRTVYRPGDQVFLASSENSFEIPAARDIAPVLEAFHREMKRTISSRESDMRARVRKMEAEIEAAETMLLPSMASPFPNPSPQARAGARVPRRQFDSSWMEYQARYLLPSRKRLKTFARVLKPLALEKWVLVFYQREIYPFRQFFGEADESSDPFGDLKKKVPENFMLADDVEPAFLAANATFHVLMLPTTTKNKFYSRFLRLEEIHSDWEETFRRIGRATGGDVLEAVSLMKSFSQVLEKEDVYYELSFVPNTGVRKRRTLTLTLNRSDLKNVEIFFPRRIDVKEAATLEREGKGK